MRHSAITIAAFAVLTLPPTTGPAQDGPVQAELRALAHRVPRFGVSDLPATGKVEVGPDRSLTIDDLRGVPLDDNPPALGPPTRAYPAEMTDDCPPDERPYIARDIAPFRFRYFDCEFNYGGWHNWAMIDYASAHGFNIVFPYNRKPSDWTNVPPGTAWLKWGGFVDWGAWLKEHQIPDLRYDRLVDLDLVKALLNAGTFRHDPEFQVLMVDMEHPWLNPDDLRKQPWYPANAPEAERLAFETKWYEGYALTYVAPIEAARREGWKSVGVYGTQPFLRQWWGLEKVVVEPDTYWAWPAFGRQIQQASDVIYPDVYCFYWSPQNVAYTLTNLDFCRKLAASAPERKPMRPYYWTLLHGGDANYHWWSNQPLTNEETRAMFAMCFFTGCEGLVLWNWSDVGSHQVPREVKEGADVMVGSRLEAKQEGAAEGAAPVAFERYDALHVRGVDGQGLARFQRIEKENWGDFGLTDDKPIYVIARDELIRHLRPSAEPVAAVVEGLALAKPFEYLLRHGEVKIDIPAQEQFAKTLPIVRRVKLGRVHLLATYDPQCVFGGPPRRIVLDDFDGHEGLTVTLPADSETRLFVLQER